PQDTQPYLLRLAPAQAALTEPAVFFQLINETTAPCEVLYIVSPAYTFQKNRNGHIIYDDSLVLEEDWEELAASGWVASQPLPTLARRAAATGYLTRTKGR